MADRVKRRTFDHDAIGRVYRTGKFSDREIAAQFECSHTLVQKYAKKYGWKKDLSSRIQKEVASKLVANIAAGNTDDEIVEAASLIGAEVVELHRGGIKKARELVESLCCQLEIAAGNREELEEQIREETSKKGEDGKADYRRRASMLKAVSLPTHSGTLLNLTNALKSLVAMERQAFNIGDGGIPDAPELGDAVDSITDLAKATRIYLDKLRG